MEPISKRPTPGGLPEKVLDRITKEHVKQKPRWVFRTKNVVFWTLWFICIVGGGSFAVAAILFHSRFAGWDMYPVTHGSLLSFLTDTFPYIWILILAAFLVLGFENVRNTKTGYRYAFSWITGLSLAACLVGGSVLYALGAGKYIDEGIGEHIPFHRPAIRHQEEFWSNPERGLLFGTVTAVEPVGAAFSLRDMNGTVWSIDGSDLPETDRASLTASSEIRLVGLPQEGSELSFHACFVIPWEVPGGHGGPPAGAAPCMGEDCAPMPLPPPNADDAPPLPSDAASAPSTCADIPGYDFILQMKSQEN